MAILSEIWSSLTLNKFRTAMTGFAVAWGIFILVVLLGASNGLQNGIQENYGNRHQNSVSIWPGWTSKPYQGLPRDRQLYFTTRQADMLRQLPEVELFSIVASTNITITFGSQYSSVSLVGIETDYQKIYKKSVLQGRALNLLDEQQKNKVCVIDERTAEELMSDNIVGNYLKINDIYFLVVGICKNGDRWEEATVHIPLSTYQTIFSPQMRFYNVVFTVNSSADMIPRPKPGQERWEAVSPFEEKVRHLLSPSMKFDPEDNRALWLNSAQEDYSNAQSIMLAIRIFIFIVGICTLISGAVGVSNIMLVSVRERTKEFGIRKAIGAPPQSILLSVVGESIMITALFGYLGMFVGIGIMEIVSRLVPHGDSPFTNPTVDMAAVSAATLILIVVGVLSGFFPALRAVRIKPIEALNYEK